MDSVQLSTIEKKIGVTFKDKKKLEKALTHPSCNTKENNERLEFFGDAVLKLVASEWLFYKYPEYTEGDLTKLRARLISDHNLAKCAIHIELGYFLKISEGEAATKGREKQSNLANAFEALLGAIYLDQGVKATEVFLTPILEYAQDNFIHEVENYKSDLQEYLHKEKVALPTYTVIDESGPEHEKAFIIEGTIEIGGQAYTAKATGKTKKETEQNVAKALLEQLKRS